jgi:hypothetical protein
MFAKRLRFGVVLCTAPVHQRSSVACPFSLIHPNQAGLRGRLSGEVTRLGEVPRFRRPERVGQVLAKDNLPWRAAANAALVGAILPVRVDGLEEMSTSTIS